MKKETKAKIANLISRLDEIEDDATSTTLDKVSIRLDSIRNETKISELFDEVEEVQKNLKNIRERVESDLKQNNNIISNIRTEIANTLRISQVSVDNIQLKSEKELSDLLTQIALLNKEIENTKQNTVNNTVWESGIKEIEGRITDLAVQFSDDDKKQLQKITEIEKDLKLELSRRLAAVQTNRGGNANRNIAVGGNTSVLSRYTDINIKAGSNITLTHSNNDTTKYLDLTIAASGGAGSGITRTIESTSVSSTVGAVSATDYVVLANGGVKVTLPTASGNTNLYTIKNIGTSSVMVATTGVETIDGDTSVIMPVRYTSIDIISNNTNWQIT